MSQTEKAPIEQQLTLLLFSWQESNLACVPAASGNAMPSFLVSTD